MAESANLEMLGNSTQYFAAFGVVVAAYIALTFLCSVMSGIRNYLLASIPDFKKYGSWAVVTGATDGIGKAYAQILAEKGMNVVLISRSQDKLTQCASDIECKYGVQTKIIVADFSHGMSIYEDIKEQLSGLDVGVLINNVGVTYACPMYLTEVTDEVADKVLQVNVFSVTMMTKMLLPRMLEKKTGFIANIASSSGVYPTPLLTVYSATKAYMHFFSMSLRVEYEGRGVTVQSVTPVGVATKMIAMYHSNFFIPGPESYVRSAMATVKSQAHTSGCLSHALQGYIFELLPNSFRVALLYKFFSYERKIELEKIARENEVEE